MLNKFGIALSLAAFSVIAHADVALGTFNFNSTQFGNTLLQSDGGTFANGNWLNIANANPGSPGFLTGANFNTGIANSGIGSTPLYTIGYSSAIVNGPGADFGVVVARFSADTVSLDVSSNGGTTFLGVRSYGPGVGVNTGVARSYFFGAVPGTTFPATLFVVPIDLSDYGVALGGTINALRVSGSPELDLIRVAGFGNPAASVPEPGSLVLAGLALAGLAAARRRQA